MVVLVEFERYWCGFDGIGVQRLIGEDCIALVDQACAYELLNSVQTYNNHRMLRITRVSLLTDKGVVLSLSCGATRSIAG